jgi:hypothetical protein
LNPDDNDAWDLATLAAQLLRRHNTPSDAVDAAWNLVEAAKRKLEVEAWLESPEARADLEKQQAEYLASLKLPYEKGVKLITGQTRWSYALKWFKQFLEYEGSKRGEKDATAYVGARLVRYRAKGFTGTEAKKLRTEFEQWRGKGRQGRVKKPATDGRLKVNKRKKLHEKGKVAMAELTKPKREWTRHYAAVTMKGARGKKARAYRDSSDQQRDTPSGQALDANPDLQAALKEPVRT